MLVFNAIADCNTDAISSIVLAEFEQLRGSSEARNRLGDDAKLNSRSIHLMSALPEYQE